MKLLLDTHSFLWCITNNPKLRRFAYDAIRDKSNEAFLSVVSAWEVLVQHKIGKLPLPSPADEYIESRRTAHRIARLDLGFTTVWRLLSLPDQHRDPFDRMPICQALDRHERRRRQPSRLSRARERAKAGLSALPAGTPALRCEQP